VVSSVLVGEHVGFPVVYFADPVPLDLERADDWGHDHYSYVRANGGPGTAHAIENDLQKDYELGPWLEGGKLAWIAPGDIELALRQGSAGCPFVGLTGDRRRQYIRAGERWCADDARAMGR
jgi:hypothetical protein